MNELDLSLSIIWRGFVLMKEQLTNALSPAESVGDVIENENLAGLHLLTPTLQ